VVGPAGPSLSKECNQLAEHETVKSTDNSRCLSRRSVSNPLTAERLREVLDYDPATGEFRWKVATSNGVRVGQVAGTTNNHGHTTILVDKVRYYAHRLVWLYVNGKFPDLDIDHIDRNPANNRLANLREATDSQNQGNSRRPRHNKSGFKGVHWNSSKKKWCAGINIGDRHVKLGAFATPEEAHAAYVFAARAHFGEFANDGTGGANVSTA
jgi:hypothetical protein